MTAINEDTPLIETQASSLSAGQLLKQAREASGMHIASLSMALKVPVKKLEALEADDWAQLSDAVFVRALTSSVCRQIKTDSTPILAALPKPASRMVAEELPKIGLNQTFRASNDPKPSLLNMPISMPMLLGAIGFLLAAMVLIFLPDMSKRSDTVVTQSVSTPVQSQNVPSEMMATVPNVPTVAPVDVAVLVAPSSTQSAAPVPNPVASTPKAALPIAASAIATATTPTTSPLAATPAPVVPATTAPVVTASTPPALRMVAKGIVWVEVKDSKGTLLLQRTMQPKEVVNVVGSAPLAVVVGRINEMQSVDVRGKPFSLAGLSPDNVARFEVK